MDEADFTGSPPAGRHGTGLQAHTFSNHGLGPGAAGAAHLPGGRHHPGVEDGPGDRFVLFMARSDVRRCGEPRYQRRDGTNRTAERFSGYPDSAPGPTRDGRRQASRIIQIRTGFSHAERRFLLGAQRTASGRLSKFGRQSGNVPWGSVWSWIRHTGQRTDAPPHLSVTREEIRWPVGSLLTFRLDRPVLLIGSHR